MRDELSKMFEKIVAKMITREEGAMFLKDLLRRHDSKKIVSDIIGLIEKPPSFLYPTTVLHTVMLTRNPVFVDLFVYFLDSSSEAISIVSTTGLVTIRTKDAQDALLKLLDNDNYHIRKSAAEALAEHFDMEGIRILENHALSKRPYYYRLTTVAALMNGGNSGISVFFKLLYRGDTEVSNMVVEVVIEKSSAINDMHIELFLSILKNAVENHQDANVIVGILTVFKALREKIAEYTSIVHELKTSTNVCMKKAALEVFGAEPPLKQVS